MLLCTVYPFTVHLYNPMTTRHWLTEEGLARRRRTFRSALAEQGFTVRDFLAEADCTATHLNFVLRGQRPSDRIDRAVHTVIITAFGVTKAKPYCPPENPNARPRD